MAQPGQPAAAGGRRGGGQRGRATRHQADQLAQHIPTDQLQQCLKPLADNGDVCSDTQLLMAMIDNMRGRLPEQVRRQLLVLPPEHYDELVETSGDWGPGSSSEPTSTRLLVDDALDAAVGGQVEWVCKADGSKADHPPPATIVFVVRTPVPPTQQQQQQAAREQQQQESEGEPQPPSPQQPQPQQQQQQPEQGAAAGAVQQQHSATHLSLLVLFNAEALGPLAMSRNCATRHIQHDRVVLLHLEPHRSRFMGKCCGGHHKCAAEFEAPGSAYVMAPVLAYLQRRVRQAGQGPSNTPRRGAPTKASRLSLLSGHLVSCHQVPLPPMMASCSQTLRGACPCHAAALVALDWAMAWPLQWRPPNPSQQQQQALHQQQQQEQQQAQPVGQAQQQQQGQGRGQGGSWLVQRRAPEPVLRGGGGAGLPDAPNVFGDLIWSPAWWPPMYIVLLHQQMRRVAKWLLEQPQQQMTNAELARTLLVAPRGSGPASALGGLAYPGPVGHLQLCQRANLAAFLPQHTQGAFLPGWTLQQVAALTHQATVTCAFTPQAQRQEALAPTRLGLLWYQACSSSTAGVLLMRQCDLSAEAQPWPLVSELLPLQLHTAASPSRKPLMRLLDKELRRRPAAAVAAANDRNKQQQQQEQQSGDQQQEQQQQSGQQQQQQHTQQEGEQRWQQQEAGAPLTAACFKGLGRLLLSQAPMHKKRPAAAAGAGADGDCRGNPAQRPAKIVRQSDAAAAAAAAATAQAQAPEAVAADAAAAVGAAEGVEGSGGHAASGPPSAAAATAAAAAAAAGSPDCQQQRWQQKRPAARWAAAKAGVACAQAAGQRTRPPLRRPCQPASSNTGAAEATANGRTAAAAADDDDGAAAADRAAPVLPEPESPGGLEESFGCCSPAACPTSAQQQQQQQGGEGQLVRVAPRVVVDVNHDLKQAHAQLADELMDATDRKQQRLRELGLLRSQQQQEAGSPEVSSKRRAEAPQQRRGPGSVGRAAAAGAGALQQLQKWAAGRSRSHQRAAPRHNQQMPASVPMVRLPKAAHQRGPAARRAALLACSQQPDTGASAGAAHAVAHAPRSAAADGHAAAPAAAAPTALAPAAAQEQQQQQGGLINAHKRPRAALPALPLTCQQWQDPGLEELLRAEVSCSEQSLGDWNKSTSSDSFRDLDVKSGGGRGAASNSKSKQQRQQAPPAIRKQLQQQQPQHKPQQICIDVSGEDEQQTPPPQQQQQGAGRKRTPAPRGDPATAGTTAEAGAKGAEAAAATGVASALAEPQQQQQQQGAAHAASGAISEPAGASAAKGLALPPAAAAAVAAAPHSSEGNTSAGTTLSLQPPADPLVPPEPQPLLPQPLPVPQSLEGPLAAQHSQDPVQAEGATQERAEGPPAKKRRSSSTAAQEPDGHQKIRCTRSKHVPGLEQVAVAAATASEGKAPAAPGQQQQLQPTAPPQHQQQPHAGHVTLQLQPPLQPAQQQQQHAHRNRLQLPQLLHDTLKVQRSGGHMPALPSREALLTAACLDLRRRRLVQQRQQQLQTPMGHLTVDQLLQLVSSARGRAGEVAEAGAGRGLREGARPGQELLTAACTELRLRRLQQLSAEQQGQQWQQQQKACPAKKRRAKMMKKKKRHRV